MDSVNILERLWNRPLYFSDNHYLWRESRVAQSGMMPTDLEKNSLNWVLQLYLHIERYDSLVNKPSTLKEKKRKKWYNIYKARLAKIQACYRSNEPITKQFVKWRKVILGKNPECFCGSVANHAHHLLYKKSYPGLALNQNNGIGLCAKHHHEIHLKEFIHK